MTKIPCKPKKWLKYPWNLKNDWNIQTTLKMTKRPQKPRNYRNSPKMQKLTKHP